MEVNITFRHEKPSNALRTLIINRINNKLSKYFIKPIKAHVILNVEGSRHIAEISLSEDHSIFTAMQGTHDMYRSVDEVLEKIERQLKKHKEIVKNHHKKPKRQPAPRESLYK